MKLTRTLLINNKPYPVIDERVALSLATPGRAQITIDAKGDVITTKSVVSFSIGYGHSDTVQRLFLGYVDKVNPLSNRVQLFCREFSAVLNAPLTMNLRHVTMLEVLSDITDKTGLKFSAGASAYSTTKTANFYNMGNGYHAMDSLAKVFKIPGYFWQQQGEGVIYAGSWDDSRWASRSIDLPPELFEDHGGNSVKMLAIPALRPGAKVNGRMVGGLQFSGHQMELTWKRT